MTLLEQIAQGESAFLEFKEARPKDSLKFVKTVVAFANGRGGRLLFGVENETGRLVGIPREKVAIEMDAIADAISNLCSPPISFDVKPAVVDGKSVIAVDVKSGEKTPYSVRSLGLRKGTFVRVGATSRLAEEHMLKGLILSGDNLSFDRQEANGIAVSSAEIEDTCQSMTEIARRNCETEAERREVRQMTVSRLVSMGLLKRNDDGVVPTYGYCIVAGIAPPGILRPQIKCGAFRGVAKGDFIDRRTCEGGVVSQIDEAYRFVLRNIRVGTRIVGTARKDVYELPVDAIREAICNAVFHRDYLSPSCVYVALYDDRLEILSPGGFVREMTVEDAKNGFSKIRNHSIGAALEYMGEVEGWGGGVSRFFESCAKMNLKPPSVIDEASAVKVTFFRTVENRETSREKSDCGNEKGDEKRKENGKRKSREMILSSLALHPDWTTADLMRETGLSRSGVEKNIRQLKAVGLLCRNGADNGGVWQVAQT